MKGSLNMAIDKTFFNHDIGNIGKKIHHRFSKINHKNTNDNDYDCTQSSSKNAKKRRAGDDNELMINPNKGNKNEQCSGSSNIFFTPCQVNQSQGQHQGLIKQSNDKDMHYTRKSMERASKTSHLNPRKLKKDKSQGEQSNMLLLIPGLNNNNQSKNSPSWQNIRKSIKNASKINLKDLSEQDQDKGHILNRSNRNVNDNLIIESASGSARSFPKPLKILIPQSEKLKEFDEELRKEERQLMIEKNVIEFTIQGKRRSRFLLDTLKIQKLNSIKELRSNGSKIENKKPNQSLVVYSEVNESQMNNDKRHQQKEKNIIIINHNYSSFSNKSLSKGKRKTFCCIPVK